MSSLHEPGQVNRREESSELDDVSLFLGLSVLADDEAPHASRERNIHPSAKTSRKPRWPRRQPQRNFTPNSRNLSWQVLASACRSSPLQERDLVVLRHALNISLVSCVGLAAWCHVRFGTSMSMSTALRCSGTASHVCSWTMSPTCEQLIHRTTAPSARPRESRSQKRPKDVQ